MKYLYDFIVKLYPLLYNRNWLPTFVWKFFRVSFRAILNRLAIYYFKEDVVNEEVNKDIIVSFTTFPVRINYVWLVVASMLHQTKRPGKVILWLSNEQFKNKEELPKKLLSYEKFGFEIRFVDGDIGSHKKYFYAFQEFKEKMIVIVDDDIFYPTDMIEKLFKIYSEQETPCVIGRYGCFISKDLDGRLLSYSHWKTIHGNANSENLFFGSGGGTLVCPKYLYRDVFRKDLFMELTPKADDIWLNAMCRLAKVPIKIINAGPPMPILITNNIKLASENLWKNKNDQQINAVHHYYKEKLGYTPF